MHERGHVEQLDGGAGAHEVLAARIARADEQQHRPQPLAPRGERAGGVAAELGAVAQGDLLQPPLAPLDQLAQARACRVEHGGELLGAAGRSGGAQGSTVPEWMAMMPPAVRIQRTSTSPTAAIAAPRPRASGKRRTEFGR